MKKSAICFLIIMAFSPLYADEEEEWSEFDSHCLFGTLIPLGEKSNSGDNFVLESEQVTINIIDSHTITLPTEIDVHYKEFYNELMKQMNKGETSFSREIRDYIESLKYSYTDENGKRIESTFLKTEDETEKEDITEERLEVAFDCLYSLKNITGKKQHINAGFPVSYERHHYTVYFNSSHYSRLLEMGKIYRNYKNTLFDFMAFIDGKEVAVRVYEKKRNPEITGDEGDAVYGFPVEFAPGESKQVRITFTVYLRHMHMWRSDYYLVDYVFNGMHGWGYYGNSINADVLLNIRVPFRCDPASVYEKTKMVYLPVKKRLHFSYNFYTDPFFPVRILINLGNLTDKEKAEFVNTASFYLKKRKDSDVDAFLSDIKNNIYPPDSGDILRKIYYWAGNDVFGSDPKTAYMYYRKAFYYIRSNLFLNNRDLKFYPNMIYNSLENWIPEKDSAPAYYIAYNIACALSRMEDYDYSYRWLTAAILLNKELLKLSQTDKDLAGLRANLPEDYKRLVEEYSSK